MKPYKSLRLTTGPDIVDIKTEGRKTSVGGKDYFKNKDAKAKVRRSLKRGDKAKEGKAV